MAGLFEETGRYIAFNTALRGKLKKDVNALMYGAGHGGFEAIVILGISSINNIIYSMMINAGEVDMLTGSLTGAAKQQIETAVLTLITTPSYHFLLGAAERIFAVALQLSLSVMVWFAVKNRNKRYLYSTAIILHCFVDAVTVLAMGYNMPIAAVEPDTVSDRILVGYGIGSEAGESQILTALIEEALVGAIAVLYAFIARKLYKAEHNHASTRS